MNLNEIVSKLKKGTEENYKGSKEAGEQNLDYYNDLNSLLIAFLLAVFSTIFIQACLSILEKSLSENLFYFFLTGIMFLSFCLSMYLLIISIVSRNQVDKYRKINENMMKSSKKNLDNLNNFKPVKTSN